MGITTSGNNYGGLKRKSDPIVIMKNGGQSSVDLTNMTYSDKKEYIEKKYADKIKDVGFYFMFHETGFDYPLNGDSKEVRKTLMEYYKDKSDYTESSLDEDTQYKVDGWEIVRKEIDPETEEVYDTTELEEISADNTYNFSYLGAMDLNWRVYYDADYEKYFYIIHPHLGGDPRGNYGEALILEGDDKEDLFYKFYSNFVSGSASIYLKFTDDSELTFYSEQDSDVFYFRFEQDAPSPKTIASKFLKDFEQLEGYEADEFLEMTISSFDSKKSNSMSLGGGVDDDTPKAYIQILGYNEGKWITLTDFKSGKEVMNYIYDWMKSLNKEKGGNREEYAVRDYEGFGLRAYDENMGESDFDDIIENYEAYESSDYPYQVIDEYMVDNGIDEYDDAIKQMDEKYYGAYDNLKDWASAMVDDGAYTPSDRDVFISDTDKRIIASEESSYLVSEMSLEELLEKVDKFDEYETQVDELKSEITSIEEEILVLNENLDSAEGDYQNEIVNSIQDLEDKLSDKERELKDLDDKFISMYSDDVESIVYDEVMNSLNNDLSDYLENLGYSKITDAPFVSVDYDEVAQELQADFIVIEKDGKHYIFYAYKTGGKVVRLGKPSSKYKYYVVELGSSKIVTAWENKSDANDSRKELSKENPKLSFGVYTKDKAEMKFGLDTMTYRDWIDLSKLDALSKANLSSEKKKFDMGGSMEKPVKKNYWDKTRHYARMGVDETKGAYADVKDWAERNDVKGKIQRGSRAVIDKTKQGASWLQKQWRDADFGDGKGKAKFFAEGGDTDDIFFVINDSNFGYLNLSKNTTSYISKRDNQEVTIQGVYHTYTSAFNDLFEYLNSRNGREMIRENETTNYSILQYDKNKQPKKGSYGDIWEQEVFSISSKKVIELQDSNSFKKGGLAYADGGGVEFIEYMGKEIMFSPHFNEYYVDDEPFSTLEEAKAFIDKGSPISEGKKDAYRKGYFKGGGITTKSYDVYDNKRMLLNQAKEVEHHAEELNKVAKKQDKVASWVIAKMERATTDLSDVTHYLDGEDKFADGGWVLYDEDTEELINVYPTESEARKNLYEYSGNANIVEKSKWDNSSKYAEGGGVFKFPIALKRTIDEINDLFLKVKDADEIAGGYFGSTHYSYVVLEKPIEIKDKYVYIFGEKGRYNRSFEKRYNVNKKGDEIDGLSSLKYELSIIKKAFKSVLKNSYAEGGGVKHEQELLRKMYDGDAVLYKGKTWYVSDRDGVIGIIDLTRGAWGSDYPFIPVSKLDMSHVTDMGGQKVQIANRYKDGGSILLAPNNELKMELGGTIGVNTSKLIEELKKYSYYEEGEVLTNAKGEKYRYHYWKLKYRSASNWLVQLFMRASKENTGVDYNERFVVGGYSFYYDRPEMKGQPNGSMQMRKLEVLNNPDIRFDGGGSVLLAPNGKPSNLNPEQYKLVRTPEFKAWFGDWENDPANASKVVDENGEPLVVYHYTDNKFNIFRLKGLSDGFFFTEYKKDSEFSTRGLKSKQYFLNIKKMAELDEMPYEEWSVPKYENEWIKKSKEHGGDGIQFIRENISFYPKEWQQNKRIIVAFEPNQIKLADGTNTTFDGDNPDIRFDTGGTILLAPNNELKMESLSEESLKVIDLNYNDIFGFYDLDWNKESNRENFKEWLNNFYKKQFNKNLDEAIRKIESDIELIKKRKIVELKLKAFEELIIPTLGNEVLNPKLSEYEEMVLMNPSATIESIEKGFQEAKNIIDEDGSINKLKITPSNLFQDDYVNLPNFEKFIQKNPEYTGVFNDWKKLFDEDIELTIKDTYAYRYPSLNELEKLHSELVSLKDEYSTGGAIVVKNNNSDILFKKGGNVVTHQEKIQNDLCVDVFVDFVTNTFKVQDVFIDKFNHKLVFVLSKEPTIEMIEDMNKFLTIAEDDCSKVFDGEVEYKVGRRYILVPLKENTYSVFAKGGSIPFQDKMFHLPLEMVVYVPSTQDVDKVISVDEMNNRVDEVKKYLADKFGGYSSTDKLGGFIDSTGTLVNEEVVQVVSFATKEAFETHKEELIKQLAKWGKKWGQEAIGLEFEGDLFYVPQEQQLMKKGGELWIQDAVDNMKSKGTFGAFTKQAKTHKMTTLEFAKEVLAHPEKYQLKTFRRAMFMKNTNPELF